jgi:GTP-binding protein
VINKVDRPGARPDWVMDQVFDLFDNLGATDEQLDFKVVYASALNGWAWSWTRPWPTDMTPLFQAIVDNVRPPKGCDIGGPFQMQISSAGLQQLCRRYRYRPHHRGKVKTNQQVIIVGADGKKRNGKVLQVMGYLGLSRGSARSPSRRHRLHHRHGRAEHLRHPVRPLNVEALPPLSVDEPTVKHDLPGQHLAVRRQGRQVRDLPQHSVTVWNQELIHNVALRVEETEDPDKFKVSGRGELHLSVLIENMRREGLSWGVPSGSDPEGPSTASCRSRSKP